MKALILHGVIFTLLAAGVIGVATLSVRHGKAPGGPVGAISDEYRIDHLTGCQYELYGASGISPRIDRDGMHIGCLPKAIAGDVTP